VLLLYNVLLKHFPHFNEFSEKLTQMYTGLYLKYALFSSDFNETWMFSKNFRKILNYQIPRKSFQWKPSRSMRTERQTDGRRDMTKLIAALRKFASASKSGRRYERILQTGWKICSLRLTFKSSLACISILYYLKCIKRRRLPCSVGRPLALPWWEKPPADSFVLVELYRITITLLSDRF
jgi:hypothetical protein